MKRHAHQLVAYRPGSTHGAFFPGAAEEVQVEQRNADGTLTVTSSRVHHDKRHGRPSNRYRAAIRPCIVIIGEV